MRDHLAKLLRGEIPLPSVARLIGFSLGDIQPGRAVVELDATERHANFVGTLHGGILCDIADAAMGVAYATMLGEDETFATVELKISFFRPVSWGRLRAEARVMKEGRTLGFVECDITDESLQLVARASSTCMRIQREQGAIDSPATPS